MTVKSRMIDDGSDGSPKKLNSETRSMTRNALQAETLLSVRFSYVPLSMKYPKLKTWPSPLRVMTKHPSG
jgi:hypothetical protein